MRPNAPSAVNDASPRPTGAPNIVVPFVLRYLRAETVAAVPDARFVDVSSDNYAYWRLLSDLCEECETFLIVEHDMAPTRAQIDAICACPEPWCSAEYQMDDIVAAAFGFVKFDAQILGVLGVVLSSILSQHRVWSGLDSMVIAELHRRGYKEHVHQPPVRHLHEPAPPPEQRRRILTKLHYVGKGRYINGVPASDFQTDDPQVVATCLESNLYEDVSPIRKVRKPDDAVLHSGERVHTPEIVKFVPFVSEPGTAILSKESPQPNSEPGPIGKSESPL